MNKRWMLIARIVGGVSLAFGIASGSLGIWAIHRQFAIGRALWVSDTLVFLIFFGIAAFCCLVGYRLLLNRPNRHGVLLARTGWRIVALCICIITLTIATIALGRGTPGAWSGALVLGLLALASIVAAWTVHRKGAYSRVFPAQTALLERKEFVPAGFSCGIEIMNDNLTPMLFVVSVLQSYVGLDEKEAARTMLQIHLRGGALLPMVSFDEAARVAREITEKAKIDNHPLACRAVRVE
jgi:ATP-dependent Clp protease adaptor protein ClpS